MADQLPEEARAELRIAKEEVRDLRAAIHRMFEIHARYFNLDVEPYLDGAQPEPEDVWRYDRDFREALLSERRKDAFLTMLTSPVTAAETTHLCPVGADSLTPCCGRYALDLPRTDRLTQNREDVTCEPYLRDEVISPGTFPQGGVASDY